MTDCVSLVVLTQLMLQTKGWLIEQFIRTVDAYIRWYNEKRIKVSLGSLSPVQYRESLGLLA